MPMSPQARVIPNPSSSLSTPLICPSVNRFDFIVRSHLGGLYSITVLFAGSTSESLRVQLRNTKVKVFDLAPPATQTELLDDFDVEDMKGASIMKVEDMVKVAVKGMQTDRFEIRPGQANQLKMMNRLAPGFILKQMSQSVDRMFRPQN